MLTQFNINFQKTIDKSNFLRKIISVKEQNYEKRIGFTT